MTQRAEVAALKAVEGVWVVEPVVYRDERGLFVETYRQEWLPGAPTMVQANRADRQAGSLVGLHYHLRQADYWYMARGEARVVLHDLRAGSATEGATTSLDLGGGEVGHRGIYIPPGVAHGFAALREVTMTYLVDAYHDPHDELGLAWDDPEVAADWGMADPILSERDRANPLRAAIPERLRPSFRE